jgi:CRISPR/Cas system CSM-associated protein Csm2 small subunit
MMRCKVQLTYKSGRLVTVESERYGTLEDMVREMTTSHWFLHSGGAENMLEVERIKPMSGVPTVADPRKVY